MVVALNMSDEARQRGIAIDVPALQAALGLRVVETVAVKRGGAAALVAALDGSAPAEPAAAAAPGPARCERVSDDPHREVNRLLAVAVRMPRRTAERDDRLDRVVLHPVLGLVLLAAVLFLMFQAVFAWARPLMEAIQVGVDALGGAVRALLPPGPLQGLLVEGVIAGAGGVLVFLPQILILFLFILVLEESGYLPRAAFLLDRFMVGVGLTGRSFIPLLSSFACAVPGIMATRTIPDPRDRLATILVAPLMTCSARLPVYALLIGAFVPDRTLAGLFNLQGLVLFVLYVAGIVSACGVAWAIKRWRGEGAAEHALLLELPSYRLPRLRSLALGLVERAKIFLNRVGGIILTLTVLLWALASWPAPPAGAAGPAIDYSLAGQLGHALQHVFAPIGFNWQICIALIPGLAAREVAVSSLATVYAVSASKEAAAEQLLPILAAQWSLATALSLLAWYVFAPQCVSTLAVIRRETNSWKTVALTAGYLFALAYAAAFVTYRVALLLS
ncbi:MAG TPA: ferrous iron transporter B, partial [Ideonella sp.]|nr:ferrous iron transporter B [Ideonella sp.]